MKVLPYTDFGVLRDERERPMYVQMREGMINKEVRKRVNSKGRVRESDQKGGSDGK